MYITSAPRSRRPVSLVYCDRSRRAGRGYITLSAAIRHPIFRRHARPPAPARSASRLNGTTNAYVRHALTGLHNHSAIHYWPTFGLLQCYKREIVVKAGQKAGHVRSRYHQFVLFWPCVPTFLPLRVYSHYGGMKTTRPKQKGSPEIHSLTHSFSSPL